MGGGGCKATSIRGTRAIIEQRLLSQPLVIHIASTLLQVYINPSIRYFISIIKLYCLVLGLRLQGIKTRLPSLKKLRATANEKVTPELIKILLPDMGDVKGVGLYLSRKDIAWVGRYVGAPQERKQFGFPNSSGAAALRRAVHWIWNIYGSPPPDNATIDGVYQAFVETSGLFID